MIAIKRRIDNIPIFPKLVLTFLIITLPLFTLSLVLISVYIRSLNGTVSTSSLEEVSGNGEEAEAIAKATYTSGIPITVWQVTSS